VLPSRIMIELKQLKSSAAMNSFVCTAQTSGSETSNALATCQLMWRLLYWSPHIFYQAAAGKKFKLASQGEKSSALQGFAVHACAAVPRTCCPLVPLNCGTQGAWRASFTICPQRPMPTATPAPNRSALVLVLVVQEGQVDQLLRVFQAYQGRQFLVALVVQEEPREEDLGDLVYHPIPVVLVVQQDHILVVLQVLLVLVHQKDQEASAQLPAPIPHCHQWHLH